MTASPGSPAGTLGEEAAGSEAARVVWCTHDGAAAAILRGLGLDAGAAGPDGLDAYRGAVAVVVPPDETAAGIMRGASIALRLRGIAAKVSRGPTAESFAVAARCGADPMTWPDVAGAAELPPWTPEEAEADALYAQEDAERQEAENRTLDLALAANRKPEASVEPEPWEDPVAFNAPLALPPVPTEALPPILADFVREVAASFEVHTDLPAACVLGVTAAACQKKYRVHVHGDHFEPTNLDLLPVAPPGDRKSAVLPYVLEPLLLYEDFLRERDKVKVELALAEHKVQATRREHLQKKAATAKEPDDRAEANRELQELVTTATEPPVLPMLTVGADVTSEALATILNQHGGRIAIADAEGGRLFGNIGGHYSNGSPNIEVLLAGHAGDLLKVHRKGGGTIVVKHPAVTTILAVQPDVVRTLAGVFKARGLAGRFLYVFPQPMAGRREFNGQAVREDVRDAYNATIRTVLELEPARGKDGSEGAHLLKFTAEAYAEQRIMSRATDRQMLPGEPLADMTDWGSKAQGAAARLAGLLHILEHAQHGSVRSVRSVPISENATESTLSLSPISPSTTTDNGTERTKTAALSCSCGGRPEDVGICPSTVLDAWSIITCLKEHARHAYALMAADAEGEFSREIVAWLKDRRPTGTNADDGLKFVDGNISIFSKRALQRRFRKREGRAAALRVLEEMGYVRRLDEKNAGGRPSERYEVNPKWAR